jgi:hypothetical protein
MGMLIAAAADRKTVTYKDVARQIQRALGNPFARVAPLNIGHVAGCLMDRIGEVAPKAPPINTLVVNAQTKLPGQGADWYVKRYLPKMKYPGLSDQAKREVLKPVHDDVFAYQEWNKVARKAFGTDAVKATTKGEEKKGESDGKAKRLGFGGPSESPEHRRLKCYVKAHPTRFGAPADCGKGVIEKRLDSQDEIDVWFMVPGEQLAVEVKSARSLESDLRRGIFQCVKYRAILNAQWECEFSKDLPKVRAKLVSEAVLPRELLRLAKILDIEIQVIKPLT